MFVLKMKQAALAKALESPDKTGNMYHAAYSDYSRLVCECTNHVNFQFFIEINASYLEDGDSSWGERYAVSEAEAVAYFLGQGLRG